MIRSIYLLNYLKARFRYGGLFRKLKRIKFQLEFCDYYLNIDLYSSVYSDLKKLDDKGLEKYYIDLLINNGKGWGLNHLLDVFDGGHELSSKTLKDFIQVVIIHKIFEVDTYINKLEIKSKSDLRDEKLNKILK